MRFPKNVTYIYDCVVVSLKMFSVDNSVNRKPLSNN